MHVVYALREERDAAEVRYVGLAYAWNTIDAGLRKRLGAHVAAATRGEATPSCVWLRTLGAAPHIDPIGVVDDEPAARALEAFWIRALLRDGHRLTNQQHSGNGFRRRGAPLRLLAPAR